MNDLRWNREASCRRGVLNSQPLSWLIADYSERSAMKSGCILSHRRLKSTGTFVTDCWLQWTLPLSFHEVYWLQWMVFGISVAPFARSSVTRFARFTDYSECKMAVWFGLLITVNAWWHRHHIYWLQWTSHKSEGGSITDYSECCWFELQRKGGLLITVNIRFHYPHKPPTLPFGSVYTSIYWLQWTLADVLLITVNLSLIAVNLCCL